MKPYNFAEYNLIYPKKKMSLYKIVLIVFLIGIIFILCKFNFHIYMKQVLLKQDNNYVIISDSNLISFLEENNKIIINSKEYYYEIKDISNNYTNINDNIYQEVTIEIKDFNSKASITECYFLKSNETLIDTIFKFITGGKT